MSTPNKESAAPADTGTDDNDGGADDFDLPLTDDTGFTSRADADDEPIVVAKGAKAKPEADAESKPDPLADLAKRRQERSQRLKAEQDRVELEHRTKELEQRAAVADRIDKLKGGKKLDLLKELGVDLNDVIAEHIETMEAGEADGVAPTQGDKALLKRLEALEAQLAAERKATEDEKTAQAAARAEEDRKRRGNGAVEVARELLSKEPDRYETINALEEHGEAFTQYAAWCQKNNVTWANDGSDEAEARETFKTFCDEFEERLAARIEKAARTKKLSARLGRRPAEAQAATTRAAAKTAPARTGRVAPPVETDDDFADIVDPRARARLLGRRISLTE